MEKRTHKPKPIEKLSAWLLSQGDFAVEHHPLGLTRADFLRIGNPNDPDQKRLLGTAASTASSYVYNTGQYAHGIVNGQVAPFMPRTVIQGIIKEYDNQELPPEYQGLGPNFRAAIELVLRHSHPAELHATPEQTS